MPDQLLGLSFLIQVCDPKDRARPQECRLSSLWRAQPSFPEVREAHFPDHDLTGAAGYTYVSGQGRDCWLLFYREGNRGYEKKLDLLMYVRSRGET